MRTLSSTFAHKHLAQIWKLAQTEPVSVEIHGEAKAVVLSAAEYKKLTAPRKLKPAAPEKHLFTEIDFDPQQQRAIPGFEEYAP